MPPLPSFFLPLFFSCPLHLHLFFLSLCYKFLSFLPRFPLLWPLSPSFSSFLIGSVISVPGFESRHSACCSGALRNFGKMSCGNPVVPLGLPVSRGNGAQRSKVFSATKMSPEATRSHSVCPPNFIFYLSPFFQASSLLSHLLFSFANFPSSD